MKPSDKLKEKEREAQFKALREELEAQIEEKMIAEDPSLRGSEATEAISDSGLLRRPAPKGGTSRNDEALSPKRVLEALLFASSRPLTANEIRKVISGISPKQIETFVSELKEEYNRETRSFELIEIAGGYQIVTRKEYASWLARLELQKKLRQASRSALETLSILAYKQPITRAEIEDLRGVDISAVLSTLLERGFIKIVGKKEVPGRPFLYGTTEKFLEHFGLKALTELPPIQEIKSLVERAVKREELIGNEPPSPPPSPPVGEREKGEGVSHHESQGPAPEN